jgi:Trk K+ transport system NAD-binding subunit
MAALSTLELAKRGKPEAIATYLNGALEPDGISVSVDRDERRLQISLFTESAHEQPDLVDRITRLMQDLHPEQIDLLRLLAYQQGSFVPLWSEKISLVDCSNQSDLSDFSNLSAQSDLSDSADQSQVEATTQTTPQTLSDHFIICGLGSLGQYCWLNLQKFATAEYHIHITAIDRTLPDDWEVDQLPALLGDRLILGNCCRDEILLQAGIETCRTILIVTSDDNVNIETAIAARRLNPQVRIVARSSRKNLNQLLKQHLGDFLALEPTELPAPSFAMPGLGEGTLGFFRVGDRANDAAQYRYLRVVDEIVQPRDYRFDNFPALMLHRRTHRLLSYEGNPFNATAPPRSFTPTNAFYHWHTDTKVQAGDRIVYIELVDAMTTSPNQELYAAGDRLQQMRQGISSLMQGTLGEKLSRFWDWMQAQRTRQLIGLGLIMAIVLWIIGTLTLTSAGVAWQKAMFSSVILLIGGYGDVFGGLEADPVPWWVMFVCLLITLTSLLFVLGALGLIAENLLSSRFEFFQRRPPVPKQGHIVLVGLGRVGRRIAALLQSFKQPIVAITEHLDVPYLASQFPILIGHPISELAKVNLATASSVISVTEDQMLNLEVALIARESASQLHRDISVVIRTYDQRFSDSLMKLLPDARALCAYELSAEAFAGAAFGENMLGLFRLNHQTILVAEYQVEQGDTLEAKLLAEIAYGYGVVPIYYQKGSIALQGETSEVFMPADDLRLHEGDRLIVLSSINGLRRIERGELMPPSSWRITAQAPLNESFLHYCGNDLARISGCSLDTARAFMDNLPGSITLPMYDYQAHHLLEELRKKLPVTIEPVTGKG